MPAVMQPVMLGPMPSFNQASGLERAPMLADVRLARNCMVQCSLAAPVAGQQTLN